MQISTTRNGGGWRFTSPADGMVMFYIPVRTTATNNYAISSRNNPQGVDPSLTDYHGAVPTASGTGWMMSTTKSAFAVP